MDRDSAIQFTAHECPRCGHSPLRGSGAMAECPTCGIIVAKYLRSNAAALSAEIDGSSPIMKESPSERPTSSAPTPPLIIFVEPAPSILSMTFSGLSTSLTLVGRLRYLLLMFIIGVICLWPMKKFIDSRNEEQKPRAPAVKTEENRTAATPAHVTIGAAPGIARSASPPSSAPAAISNTAFGNSTEGEALKRRARLIFTEIVAMESIQYKEYGEFSDHLSTLLSDYQHQVPDHSEGLLNELHREGRVFLRVGAGKVQVAVRDWPYKGLWMMYTLLNDFRTRERMEESPTSSPPW